MLKESYHTIEGDLATEEGCVLAATKIGEVVLEQILVPVLEHTPPEMRVRLIELVHHAVVGALGNQIGDDSGEQLKRILDDAKEAIDAIVAKRRQLN